MLAQCRHLRNTNKSNNDNELRLVVEKAVRLFAESPRGREHDQRAVRGESTGGHRAATQRSSRTGAQLARRDDE